MTQTFYTFYLGNGPDCNDKVAFVLNPGIARQLMRELKRCLLPVYENGKGYADQFTLTISGHMQVQETEVIDVPFKLHEGSAESTSCKESENTPSPGAS